MDPLKQYADEIGPTAIIFIGLVLVIIPEPASSAFGVGLMLFGAAYWIWEWNRP
ncbi:hypothetical protein C453_17479 [Haloferax elongans ATCC BAA-1513]|uniref:Uncharacterized protein n=1 Tax=Haloferax elongans ATCC BAA-1513 TaxID=1230453 RepID=M0HBF5_HALEO|nr:hypothetical protein [Haloferax elongans]ELZ81830.1 hypothetical protein C453_17479 [Haloferax elongans ATCC BAA-1513]